MGYSAKILEDVQSPSGDRLTTFLITFPRIVLAEFNTHRVFSRNSASSRAIPLKKQIEGIEEDPFIPDEFPREQKGMQGGPALEDKAHTLAISDWRMAMSDAIEHARLLARGDVHKSLCNRLLEPFMWHTVIVSSTEWSNFFALRMDENAQKEIRIIAEMMKALYDVSEPLPIDVGEWTTPLVSPKEILEDAAERGGGAGWEYWKKVSVGRCARISYLTHDGVRDPQKDIELHDRLLENGHFSPFEHVATPVASSHYKNFKSSNFKGFLQYRKLIPFEHDFGAKLRA